MANPVGRPSDYRPEFCEIVVREMKEGAAIQELPLHFDVCLDTIYEWKKVHPEFSEAIKKGEGYSQAWWMTKGRKNIENKEFNSTLWYMNMKNRHDWRDNKDTRHDVAEGSLMEKLINKL